MSAKLIALDLDGTTLNQNGQLSEKTQNALRTASHRGHKIIITTGRPDNISEPFYDQLALTTPMINFNGALVHIPHQHWSQEQATTLPQTTALALLQLKRDFPIKVAIAEGKQFILPDRPFHDLPFFTDMPAPKVLLNADSLRQAPISLSLFTDALTLPRLQQAVSERFPHVVAQTWGAWSGEFSALEIVREATHKSSAIQYLLDYYQMDPNDVLAFGDDDNDRDLLTYAGWGVAMQNARPAIKALANDVTPLSNAEDGVAEYLIRRLAL
ncbi:Cof-type HAD-IIB family hydrolase [Loigolactobacillus zhaoyuanensis]|uniref:Cof-type HAD-IIB family hydrolase n=1 Tax=Loigolactobacillus zhaoyuanensis TaxID=2486017 RepID=A0ABW8UB42_9LACO|nr:Cof-type HAD-IIB family hydrolase [Loigolactobacillus zhaoyuanensis]